MSEVTEKFALLNRFVVDMMAEANMTPDYVDMMIKSALQEENKQFAVERLIKARLSVHASALAYFVSELMTDAEARESCRDYENDRAMDALKEANEKIGRLEAAAGHKVHPINDATVRDAPRLHLLQFVQGRPPRSDAAPPDAAPD